jgi:hypothetical protein
MERFLIQKDGRQPEKKPVGAGLPAISIFIQAPYRQQAGSYNLASWAG